jgi:chromosome segregation ATPase
MSNSEVNPSTPQGTGTPRWLALALVIPVAISVWALWSSANASRATQQAQQTASAQAQELRSTVDQLQQRLAVSEQERQHAESQLATVNDQLHKTQGQVGYSRKQDKQFREDTAKQISDMQADVSKQLGTKASTDDLNAVSGDVKGVRSDLDATKQNLQMARSEMGTLIARNHEEIDQLRRLGLRDYYEFTIEGKGSEQKVGDISVELRGTNTKKHSYTVKLLVDDMKLEKKNRSINEPVFFYKQGDRRSCELVINQIGKNKITGYLSMPKAAAAAQSSGG